MTNKIFAALLTKFLRSSGYSCDSTTDPAEALEVLKRDSFELVISDIKMEGMDGLRLLSEIIKIDPEVDTIMMTGHSGIYTYSDIIKAGAADFIAKPFQLPELKAKMERIDRERKIQRELKELNIALGVLFQRAEKDKETLSENVVFNVKELILPYVDKLKNGHLSEDYKAYIEIMRTNLSEICSPLYEKFVTAICEHQLNGGPGCKSYQGRKNKQRNSLDTRDLLKYRYDSPLSSSIKTRVEPEEGQPEVLPELHRILVNGCK